MSPALSRNGIGTVFDENFSQENRQSPNTYLCLARNDTPSRIKGNERGYERFHTRRSAVFLSTFWSQVSLIVLTI